MVGVVVRSGSLSNELPSLHHSSGSMAFALRDSSLPAYMADDYAAQYAAASGCMAHKPVELDCPAPAKGQSAR